MNGLSVYQITSMIHEGESINVDFKRTLFPTVSTKPPRTLNRELVKDLSAFANTEGGYLFVGIDDDGSVLGFESSDELEQKTINLCRDLCSPPLRPKYQKVELEGKHILIIGVDKGLSDLVMVDGKIYIRVHTEVRMATSAEISDLILKRNHARLRGLLQENDNLSSLILKVSRLSAELFKANNLIDEIAFNYYCSKSINLRNYYDTDVIALVSDGESILTNLESVEINNLANYIVQVNNLIDKLAKVNTLMEECLGRYYEGMESIDGVDSLEETHED